MFKLPTGLFRTRGSCSPRASSGPGEQRWVASKWVGRSACPMVPGAGYELLSISFPFRLDQSIGKPSLFIPISGGSCPGLNVAVHAGLSHLFPLLTIRAGIRASTVSNMKPKVRQGVADATLRMAAGPHFIKEFAGYVRIHFGL